MTIFVVVASTNPVEVRAQTNGGPKMPVAALGLKLILDVRAETGEVLWSLMLSPVWSPLSLLLWHKDQRTRPIEWTRTIMMPTKGLCLITLMKTKETENRSTFAVWLIECKIKKIND
jgi:hypothetical protein